MVSLKLASLSLCVFLIFVETRGSDGSAETESNTLDSKLLEDGAIQSGRYYRIRNKKSNLYLSEVSITQKRPASIEQWPLVATGIDRASQLWLVYPIDNGRYRLENKRTGLSLVTAGNSPDPAAFTHQYFLQTHLPRTAETWLLQRDETTEGLYYNIKNELSGYFLVIQHYSKDPAGLVQQWIMQEDANRASQQWAFEIEEEFPTVLAANRIVTTAVEDIGDVQRITSWKQPTPSKTPEVLIGQIAIPFALIVETELSLSDQSQQTPFYFLRRYGYWQRILYHEHSGSSEIRLNTTVTIGLTTYNAKEIEKFTGLTVSSEGSLILKALRPKMIRSKIARGLKIGVGGESGASTTRLVQLEQKYVTDRQIDAVWFRQDRFVLQRLNGDIVVEWITRDSTSINDSFRGRQMALPFDGVFPADKRVLIF